MYGCRPCSVQPGDRAIQPLLVEQVEPHGVAAGVVANRASVDRGEDDARRISRLPHKLRDGRIAALALVVWKHVQPARKKRCIEAERDERDDLNFACACSGES